MPHEPEHTSPDRNLFSWIHDAIDIVHGRVDKVEGQLKVPTNPVYDSTQFPDEAVIGQIALDRNDLDSLWVFSIDETWHQVGGGIAWAGVSVQKSGAGSIIPSTANNYGSAVIAPFDNTSDTIFQTNDPDRYEIDAINNGLLVHGEGTFIVGTSFIPQNAGNGLPTNDITKNYICSASDDGGDVSFASLAFGSAFASVTGFNAPSVEIVTPPPWSMNIAMKGALVDRRYFAKMQNRSGVTIGFEIATLFIARISSFPGGFIF